MRHGRTDLELDSWERRKLFAFVERKEPVGEHEFEVIFDAIRADDVNDLLGYADPVELARTPGVLISGRFSRRNGADDLVEGSWVRATLSESGVGVGVFAELNSDPVSSHLTFSVLGKTTSQMIAKSFDLTGLFPEASTDELKWILRDLRSDLVAIYNVGQGSCSAVCDQFGRPFLYFDVGGGCLWNSKTYQKPLQFCTGYLPSVVLSHWDFDHWFSATQVPALRHMPWLVPNQGPVGRRTLAFASSLPNARFWPAARQTCSRRGITIVRCLGASRNDSGLALFARLRRGAVLLPADAQFNFIPAPSGTGALVGLAATHHGSSHVGTGIPRPGPNAKLAYSFGHNNTYGHPTADARALYNAEGWTSTMARETPNGHIWLGRSGLAGMHCGTRCDLKTIQ